MARAGLCLAVLLAGCGLAARDFEVEQPFTAGGLPSFSGSFDSSRLTGPLSADVGRISSITLKAARIEATDGQGGIPFVANATISVGAKVLPDAIIARLPAPPGAADTKVDLTVDSSRELKPYLQAGGTVSAAIDYSPVPATARELKLVLTIHGSLL